MWEVPKHSRSTRLVAFIAATVASFHPACADIKFSAVEFPGNVKVNNSNLEHGGRFWNRSGAVVTITKLGRYVTDQNTRKHTLKLYDVEGNVLAATEVDTDGAPRGEFVWGDLPEPVNVGIGDYVFILSTETEGGDYWHWAYGNPNAGEPYNQNAPYHKDVGVLSSAKMVDGKILDTGGWSFTYGPVSFQYSAPVRSWTKEQNVYTTSGEVYQVKSALVDASPGDTVLVPAGSFTWGTNNTSFDIPPDVTLMGAGMGKTIINMDRDSPTGYSAYLFRLQDKSTLGRMTINGPDAVNCPLVSVGGANDWRLTEIDYNQFPSRNSYFVFGNGALRGLIDGCEVEGGAGNSELIFMRGPTDAWDQPHNMGGGDNVFVEDCIFSGIGYVCDANSNASMVVRHCTIDGPIKVDGHGVASNSPANSFRTLEIYGNRWTHLVNGGWAAIEFRGGSGRIFNNIGDIEGQGAIFAFREYGVTAKWPNFGSVLQTPDNYPVRDQVGRGRYASPGDWTTATSEPVYVWNNTKAGDQWPLYWVPVPAESITNYGDEFTLEDIIAADRDYFREVDEFDGSTGVGVGTAAEMNAIVPSKEGVGFWVTDEADWNAEQAGPDGQLYVWDGDSWVLEYTPYTYPHPLRGNPVGPSAPASPPKPVGGLQTVPE